MERLARLFHLVRVFLQDFKRVLVYGGEDEFVDEDMRKSCSELTVMIYYKA